MKIYLKSLPFISKDYPARTAVMLEGGLIIFRGNKAIAKKKARQLADAINVAVREDRVRISELIKRWMGPPYSLQYNVGMRRADGIVLNQNDHPSTKDLATVIDDAVRAEEVLPKIFGTTEILIHTGNEFKPSAEKKEPGITFNDLHNGYMSNAKDAVRIVHHAGISVSLNMAKAIEDLAAQAKQRAEWLRARALNVQRSVERRQRFDQARTQAREEAAEFRRKFGHVIYDTDIDRRANQILKEREAVDARLEEASTDNKYQETTKEVLR